MWRRKSKTLTQSPDLMEDIEISVQLSPQLKQTCLPTKCLPSSSDWQKCADSFSGLCPLPERGKKRKRHYVSALQHEAAEKKSNKSQSAKEFGKDEIVWSSSDEDEPSSQVVQRHKSQLQQKVQHQILATSTHTTWPTELCNSLPRQNMQTKFRTSCKKIPADDQETSWQHQKHRKLLTKKLHRDEETNFDVQEFDDSDEDFISKEHEVQKSTTIDAFSSDEESIAIGCTASNSSPIDEQVSNSCSRSDVDISSWSSSNFSGECAATDGRSRKTSEWLQALQMMVTPTETENNSGSSSEQETSNMFGSVKKKRRHKYKKNGLAQKLSRVISREKTTMNIWLYQQSLLNDQKNILTACVHRFFRKFRMVIALCTLGTLSQNHEWTSKSGESRQTILFSRRVFKIFKIQAGSIIRIFPPWQEMFMPYTDEKILLCTYYCRKVEPLPYVYDMMDNPFLGLSRMVCKSFYWNCPCSTSDGPLRYCPASTCPVLTKYPRIQTGESSEVFVNKQTSEPSTLFTVVCVMTENAGEARTILNSIQEAPTSFQQGLCFQAMVLRIFCSHNSSVLNMKKCRQNVQSWSVLVEDSQGTVCIVRIPEEKTESENTLTQLIQSTEGETWNFFGLRVFSRSNRHKDPALFSIIDKVWIHQPQQNESPKSNSGSDHVITAQMKPGFCYVTGQSGYIGFESGVLPYKNTFILDEPVAQPKLLLRISTLKEIKQEDNDTGRMRLTFIAKIFYLRSKSKEPQKENQSGVGANANAKMVLFLSDPSVSEEPYSHNYMTVYCLPSCYFPFELTNPVRTPDSVLVLMRDVLFEQDMLAFADRYTRIWLWPPPESIQHQFVPSVCEEFIQNCGNLSIPLQSLQENSQCNCLFKVQGVIYSVDHKTAITWETCPYCDEEQLAFRQDNQDDKVLVCLNCDVQVEESDTHINLEVILRCLSLPGHYEVRVNLLQPTVESLLPNGDHKDGYDVSAVLGQQVGPLICLLKKQSTSQQHPVFFLEEIQPV